MDVQKEISLRNAIGYCIENNDANTATNRIMEFIRDEKEAINFIRCCKSDNEQLVLFADWLQYNGKWSLPEQQAKDFLKAQQEQN
jgi:hypothetical protein